MFTIKSRNAAARRLAPWAAGLALAATVSAAQAGLMLEVGNANQAVTVARGTALGTSFTLDAHTSNVTIDIPVLCISCSGSIWLVKDAIGPGSSFLNTVSGNPFNSASTSPEFSLADLAAGLYFVLLAMDDNSAGSALWSGSTAPTVFSDGAHRALDFQAASTTAWVPFSNFGVTFGKGLNITVSGTTAAAVPVTPTPALLGLGLLALALQARRQRRRTLEAATRDNTSGSPA